MIDHVSLQVRDLGRAAALYEAALQPLGYVRIAERGTAVAFGKRYPEVWLNARPASPPRAADEGAHLCLRARSEEAVRAFHAAALAQGGCEDRAPGPYAGEMTPYFAAFVRDHDGNRLEAATFPGAPA